MNIQDFILLNAATDLRTAITLLAVGMITVFIVLLLVVLTGKALIRLSNYLLEKAPQSVPPATEPTSHPDVLQKKKVAAVVAAVQQITNGHGQISKIERIN